jgi:hypothetical protein
MFIKRWVGFRPGESNDWAAQTALRYTYSLKIQLLLGQSIAASTCYGAGPVHVPGQLITRSG